jgi:hypothetical protein
LAVGPAGQIALIDGATWRIRVLQNGVVDTVAGGTSYARIDGTGAQAGFAMPRAVAFDGNGSLIVVDVAEPALRRITLP